MTFRAQVGPEPIVPSRDQVGTKSGVSRGQVKIIDMCCREKTLLELMNAVGRKNRSKFRDQFLKPLLEMGFIEMTIPDKPNSRLQKYRVTETGINAFQNREPK